MDNEILKFAYNSSAPSILKVIGVGGGGGNAVNHMYQEGIHDVNFVLCNTDNQALSRSPVTRKLQLGASITEGLGAGNRPNKAKEAAEESREEIGELFTDGCKMVFITAGMGGGTGTGAAPVIAQIAKDHGMLTVGIVTIPFLFEGERKILQALDGVKEMEQYVDALLVINNEKLREIYPDLNFSNAFRKADDTLTMAAKSIAEIITVDGYINLDFADVKSILKDGGIAIMSTGYGEGEKRVQAAIEDALNSPLLNSNDVFGAKKVLLNFYMSEEGDSQVKMAEMNDVNDFMLKFNKDIEVIWGVTFDNTLGEAVKVTILANGFGSQNLTNATLFNRNNVSTTADNQPAKDMINDYYDESSIKQLQQSKARASYIILTPEQMLDDTLLDMIEKSPAYNREPQFLSKIKNREAITEKDKKDITVAGPGGTINF